VHGNTYLNTHVISRLSVPAPIARLEQVF
jgi:hypothetical protein